MAAGLVVTVAVVLLIASGHYTLATVVLIGGIALGIWRAFLFIPIFMGIRAERRERELVIGETAVREGIVTEGELAQIRKEDEAELGLADGEHVSRSSGEWAKEARRLRRSANRA